MVENYQVVSSVRGPRKANFSLGLYITIVESRILRNKKYGSIFMLTAPSALPSPSLVTGSCALTPPSPYVSCGQIWPRWHAWAESASAAAHPAGLGAMVGRHSHGGPPCPTAQYIMAPRL